MSEDRLSVPVFTECPTEGCHWVVCGVGGCYCQNHTCGTSQISLPEDR